MKTRPGTGNMLAGIAIAMLTIACAAPVDDRDSASGAGAVNPAAMQLDFYIRSPETNDANHPGREVLDHFFAMEVAWR